MTGATPSSKPTIPSMFRARCRTRGALPRFMAAMRRVAEDTRAYRTTCAGGNACVQGTSSSIA